LKKNIKPKGEQSAKGGQDEFPDCPGITPRVGCEKSGKQKGRQGAMLYGEERNLSPELANCLEKSLKDIIETGQSF